MKALNKVMGYVMQRLRGRVDGRTVADVAKRKINEFLASAG